MPAPDERLTAALDALANPLRLAIVRQLRAPRALREIEVRQTAGDHPALLARQTVRWHLGRLVECGIVDSRGGQRDYGETTEFTVNHQRIFSLAEDVRALARIRPVVEPDAETVASDAAEPPSRPGARLVMVRGIDEGIEFHVDPRAGQRQWMIGRRRGLAVSLDFDPSVSAENTVLAWKGSFHVVQDIPGSRNGTTINFRRLPPGEERRLVHGDIIGVGRCLLVYWT